jgi:hypothetical protein
MDKILPVKVEKAGTLFQSDAVIFDPIEVVIAEEMLHTCKLVQSNFPGLEWSILCKGELGKDGFEVESDFVIPKQEVTSAEVNFTDRIELEQYRALGYNTIIHSHPFKSESFSGSDRTTLSVNYDCSILFSQGAFTTATVSFRLGGENEQLLIVDTKVCLLNTYITLPDNLKSVITEKTFARPANACYQNNSGWNKGKRSTKSAKELRKPVKILTMIGDFEKAYNGGFTSGEQFHC